eukprot:scaffold9371_cov66-Cyclotella_meneghiniana.AAC.5
MGVDVFFFCCGFDITDFLGWLLALPLPMQFASIYGPGRSFQFWSRRLSCGSIDSPSESLLSACAVTTTLCWGDDIMMAVLGILERERNYNSLNVMPTEDAR